MTGFAKTRNNRARTEVQIISGGFRGVAKGDVAPLHEILGSTKE